MSPEAVRMLASAVSKGLDGSDYPVAKWQFGHHHTFVYLQNNRDDKLSFNT